MKAINNTFEEILQNGLRDFFRDKHLYAVLPVLAPMNKKRKKRMEKVGFDFFLRFLLGRKFLAAKKLPNQI